MTDLPIRHIFHDFLLSRQRCLCPPVHVAVSLCRNERDKVDSRPCFLSLKLSAIGWGISLSTAIQLLRASTHRRSKFPLPTLQNPHAHIAKIPLKTIAPPGPRTGRLRLYRMLSKPPGGGRSCPWMLDAITAVSASVERVELSEKASRERHEARRARSRAIPTDAYYFCML